MAAPLRVHDWVGVGSPEAVQRSVTLAPAIPVTEEGCAVTTGSSASG